VYRVKVLFGVVIGAVLTIVIAGVVEWEANTRLGPS